MPSDDDDNVGGARTSNIPRYRPAAAPNALQGWQTANKGHVAVPAVIALDVASVQDRLADEPLGQVVGAVEVDGKVMLLGKKEDIEKAHELLSLPRQKKVFEPPTFTPTVRVSSVCCNRNGQNSSVKLAI